MEAAVLERTLTELDHIRLTRLVQRAAGSALAQANHPLCKLLDAADVVPSQAIPRDVVTMNSRVELWDPATEQCSTMTLRYPADADPASGAVSVMSPLGMELLGLPAGSTVRWGTADGRSHGAALVSVLFQPEAAGDYLA
ncbi:nucleoside diphosphate kinase regulator [Aquincola sp. MAHUQ-54]|uniref:Nucleoside diphosphate kinase regulator n=1 Tax=Aquincola agrisoli TaxID=3119538 RepID=A0AAW9Q812_9BURK